MQPLFWRARQKEVLSALGDRRIQLGRSGGIADIIAFKRPPNEGVKRTVLRPAFILMMLMQLEKLKLWKTLTS
jgi:hypothetical protein